MKIYTVVSNLIVAVLCLTIGFFEGEKVEQEKNKEKWDFYKTIIKENDDAMYLETIHNSSDSMGMFCLSFLEASINEKPSAYRDAYEYSDIFDSKTISLKCLQKGVELNDPRCLIKNAWLYKKKGMLDSSIVMMKRSENKKIEDTLVYIEQKGGKTVTGRIANILELSSFPGLFRHTYEFETNGDIYKGFMWDDKSKAIGDTIKIFYDSINPKTNIPIM